MRKTLVAACLIVLIQLCIAVRGETAEPPILPAPAMDVASSSYFAERCQVITRGGNLNVRNEYGDIIAKLPNRIWVTVLGRSGYTTRISVTVRRQYIRGWVASEFLGNCR